MSNLFDLLRLWLREYFKHPVENIRQANPVIPNRLYRNFGNTCKARPYNSEEKHFLAIAEAATVPSASPEGVITPDGLLEMFRTSGADKTSIERLQLSMRESDYPAKCSLCDFHKSGVPCPIYNTLQDGSCVCDTNRYIIIKHAPKYGN